MIAEMDEIALRVAYSKFMDSPNWKLMSFEEFKAQHKPHRPERWRSPSLQRIAELAKGE